MKKNPKIVDTQRVIGHKTICTNFVGGCAYYFFKFYSRPLRTTGQPIRHVCRGGQTRQTRERDALARDRAPGNVRPRLPAERRQRDGQVLADAVETGKTRLRTQ